AARRFVTRQDALLVVDVQAPLVNQRRADIRPSRILPPDRFDIAPAAGLERQQRSVAAGRGEDEAVRGHRRRRDPVRQPLVLPELLAGRGVIAAQLVLGVHYQLPFTIDRDDDRRAPRAEEAWAGSLPEFLAGLHVEGDQE